MLTIREAQLAAIYRADREMAGDMATLPAVLDLPTDYPRPPVQRFRGRELSHREVELHLVDGDVEVGDGFHAEAGADGVAGARDEHGRRAVHAAPAPPGRSSRFFICTIGTGASGEILDVSPDQ